MPALFEIDAENRLIYSTLTGEVDRDEIEQQLQGMKQAPEFDSDFDVLTNLMDCTMNIKAKDIRELTPLFQEVLSSKKGRSAILVDTPNESALSLMQQIANKKYRKIELFSTRKAALKWLNREENQVK